MTNIFYFEPSEYGQDILDLLALVASLMGNEPVYSKKGILSVLGEMRGKISAIEEGTKRKGIGYFTEESEESARFLQESFKIPSNPPQTF